MAQLDSRTRIRFVIGGGKGNATTTGVQTRSLASAIAQRVAFQAAEDSYQAVARGVRESFHRDAKRELTHLMALYKRHIIGAAPGRRRPSGMLSYALTPSGTGVGDDDREVAIADSLPEWAPRSPEYLRQKKRRGWSQGWFSAEGTLRAGLTPDLLLGAYGPIRVSVIRDVKAEGEYSVRMNKQTASSFSRLDARASGDTLRMNVATVRIYAMEKITPSMLPALVNGDPAAMNSDDISRGRRLLEPLASSSALGSRLALRLGRPSYRSGRYRPTLDPFLAWYLTRSIPNALALRIEEGIIGSSRRAGRGRSVAASLNRR